MKHFIVQRFELRRIDLGSELLDVSIESLLSHLLPSSFVRGQFDDRITEPLAVIDRNDQSSLAIYDDLGRPSAIGCDHGTPHRHRLDRRQGKRFRERRNDEQIDALDNGRDDTSTTEIMYR